MLICRAVKKSLERRNEREGRREERRKEREEKRKEESGKERERGGNKCCLRCNTLKKEREREGADRYIEE